MDGGRHWIYVDPNHDADDTHGHEASHYVFTCVAGAGSYGRSFQFLYGPAVGLQKKLDAVAYFQLKTHALAEFVASQYVHELFAYYGNSLVRGRNIYTNDSNRISVRGPTDMYQMFDSGYRRAFDEAQERVNAKRHDHSEKVIKLLFKASGEDFAYVLANDTVEAAGGWTADGVLPRVLKMLDKDVHILADTHAMLLTQKSSSDERTDRIIKAFLAPFPAGKGKPAVGDYDPMQHAQQIRALLFPSAWKK